MMRQMRGLSCPVYVMLSRRLPEPRHYSLHVCTGPLLPSRLLCPLCWVLIYIVRIDYAHASHDDIQDGVDSAHSQILMGDCHNLSIYPSKDRTYIILNSRLWRLFHTSVLRCINDLYMFNRRGSLTILCGPLS